MSIFYLIFLALTIYYSIRFDSIEEYDSHKQHRLWLMCIYLICLTGFSFGLGGDKFVYLDEFERYPDNISETWDYIFLNMTLKGEMPLWTIVNLLCKTIFKSFYSLQLIQSATINIAVCYMISRYTHRYFIFLLLYFLTYQYFIFNTEVMREGFAMAFALVGMHGWMNEKKWFFMVSIPIALLFHISAAIALLFPFIQFKVSWKTLSIAFMIAFGMWIFSDLMLNKLMIAVLGGMGAFVKKVLFYSLQATTIFGFLRSFITFILFPFIIMYTSLLIEPSEQMRKCKEKMTAYMVVLGVLACSFAGFVRLYDYAKIFYLILFADFVYMLFRTKKHFIIRTMTLVGTILLLFLQSIIYYKTTNTYYYQYFYPYTCILDENPNVYIREVAHAEAVFGEEKDNNVRDIK